MGRMLWSFCILEGEGGLGVDEVSGFSLRGGGCGGDDCFGV